MTVKYEVHITKYAYSQMREIRRYIEEELCAPSAAKNLLHLLKNKISDLQLMPSKHQLVEEPWCTKGVRRLTVKNFIKTLKNTEVRHAHSK